MNQSKHPYLRRTIYLPIERSVSYLSIQQTIYLFNKLSIYSTDHLSIQQIISLSNKLSIYSTNHLSIQQTIHLFNKPSIYQSKHISLHPTIYPFIEKVSRFVETSTYPSNPYFFVELSTYTQTSPVSYTMSTGSLPGVKRPGCGADNPPHLTPRLKKE
jgi:hypothetical protein